MENIPKKIYLQVDPENEKPEDFNELGEVTWCRDKINNNDIPYYRHGNNNPLDLLVIPKIAEEIDRQLEIIEQELFYGSELNTDWRLGRKDAYLEMKKYIDSNFSE